MEGQDSPGISEAHPAERGAFRGPPLQWPASPRQLLPTN